MYMLYAVYPYIYHIYIHLYTHIYIYLRVIRHNGDGLDELCIYMYILPTLNILYTYKYLCTYAYVYIYLPVVRRDGDGRIQFETTQPLIELQQAQGSCI